MRYLFIKDNDHWLQEEVSESEKLQSEAGLISIFDLELKTFHVKENTWQTIQEK